MPPVPSPAEHRGANQYTAGEGAGGTCNGRGNFMTTARNPLLLILLSTATFCAATSFAADVKEIETVLKREIFSKTLPLDEVQRYCDAKVPRLGKFKTQADWQTEADRLRAAVLDNVLFRGEAKAWRDAPVRIEWLDTIPGGPGYHIKKLRYEALPGMWIPALLYEPENLTGKVPVIMNVNGHSGAIGKAENQKQTRCINQAKRGMIALNVEWIGMGQLGTPGFSHARMNQLDLCGTSGIAPFFLSMKHGLDVLLSLEHADPQRVGVTGLSGGGWQTIFISSLDTRVKFCTPVAGYSSFRTRAYHLKDLGDSEQTPCDLATVVDYTHLTAMLAPRAALLVFNSKDNCCFESGYALPPLYEAAGQIYRLFAREQFLRYHINNDPGTHNYEKDNRQALYRALGDYFYPGDKSFDAAEIPVTPELKTRDQLLVEMPAKNEDFNSLALALSKNLPRISDLPAGKPSALKWQESARAALGRVVKPKDFKVNAINAHGDTKADLKVTYWQFDLNGTWTVPGVELSGENAKQTAILISDAGRATAAADAARLLSGGYRVIAIDPLNIGESVTDKHSWLFGLLLAAVGDRPIGIQASQIAAISRWAAEQYKTPVTVIASGHRSSAAALIDADIETKAIAGLELHNCLATLKEVIEKNEPYNGGNGMELFCFGLLETMDIKQMAALVAPRPVKFVNATERAKVELGALVGWYKLLEQEFNPV